VRKIKRTQALISTAIALLSIGAIAGGTTVAEANVLLPHRPAGAMTVSKVVPATIPVTGNVRITVTVDGIDGASRSDARSIAVDGVSCSQALTSNTDLNVFTCVAPPHTEGAAKVVVTYRGVASDAGTLTYAAQPYIERIVPDNGGIKGGTKITVYGIFLDRGTHIYIGDKLCLDFKVYNDKAVYCTSPAVTTAGIVDFRLYGEGGWYSNERKFEYLNQPPTVTGFSPSIIAGAAAPVNLTITGTNFTGKPTVTIGGADCTGVNVISDTTATCTYTPSAAGAFAVSVTNASLTGIADKKLTVVSGPSTIRQIYPRGGKLAGGDLVTIYGTNFTSTTTVKVGRNECANVQLVNSEVMTCTSPAGTAGSTTILANNGIQNTSNSTVSYLYGNPTTGTLRAQVNISSTTSRDAVAAVLKKAFDTYLNKSKVLSLTPSLHLVAANNALFDKLASNSMAIDAVANGVYVYMDALGFAYTGGLKVMDTRDNDTSSPKSKTGFYSVYVNYQYVK